MCCACAFVGMSTFFPVYLFFVTPPLMFRKSREVHRITTNHTKPQQKTPNDIKTTTKKCLSIIHTYFSLAHYSVARFYGGGREKGPSALRH